MIPRPMGTSIERSRMADPRRKGSAGSSRFQIRPLAETLPKLAVDGGETRVQGGAEHWLEIVSNE